MPAWIKRAPRWLNEISALNDCYKGQYVKDPRFCLTINNWDTNKDIEKIFFIFRNPSAVAGSINRREKLPVSYAYNYWLYHIEGFLTRAPKDRPIYFFNFDHFLSAEKQDGEFEKLARAFDHNLNIEDASITKLVKPGDITQPPLTQRHSDTLPSNLRTAAQIK